MTTYKIQNLELNNLEIRMLLAGLLYCDGGPPLGGDLSSWVVGSVGFEKVRSGFPCKHNEEHRLQEALDRYGSNIDIDAVSDWLTGWTLDYQNVGQAGSPTCWTVCPGVSSRTDDWLSVRKHLGSIDRNSISSVALRVKTSDLADLVQPKESEWALRTPAQYAGVSAKDYIESIKRLGSMENLAYAFGMRFCQHRGQYFDKIARMNTPRAVALGAVLSAIPQDLVWELDDVSEFLKQSAIAFDAYPKLLRVLTTKGGPLGNKNLAGKVLFGGTQKVFESLDASFDVLSEIWEDTELADEDDVAFGRAVRWVGALPDLWASATDEEFIDLVNRASALEADSLFDPLVEEIRERKLGGFVAADFDGVQSARVLATLFDAIGATIPRTLESATLYGSEDSEWAPDRDALGEDFLEQNFDEIRRGAHVVECARRSFLEANTPDRHLVSRKGMSAAAVDERACESARTILSDPLGFVGGASPDTVTVGDLIVTPTLGRVIPKTLERIVGIFQ